MRVRLLAVLLVLAGCRAEHAGPVPDPAPVEPENPARARPEGWADLTIRLVEDRTGKAREGHIYVLPVTEDEAEYERLVEAIGHPTFDWYGDGSETSLMSQPTDAEGVLRLPVPPSVPLEVSGFVSTGDVGPAAVTVDPLPASGTHEVTVRLSDRPNLTFHGQLVAEEDGSPIRGATIRLIEELTPEFDPVAVGDDGRFRVEAHDWRRPQVRVEAPGRSPVDVNVIEEHETADRELEIRLGSGAALTFTPRQLAPRLTRQAIVVARAELLEIPYEIVYHFGPLREGFRRVVRAEPDEAITLEDLPCGVELEFEVDGEKIALPNDLVLKPGRHRWEDVRPDGSLGGDGP